jgi:hypothetical protein
MTPSLQIGSGNWAVKSDSLLGYKTIDGKYYPREMTFTRATTGTRVNAAGLVEVVPYNLLSYSEDFSNVAWSVSNRILPVTSNSTIAPNGTLSADTITENTSTGSHYIGQPATIVGVQYNLSVYAKINGRNRIVLTEAGGIVLAIFNISNGTLVSGTGNIENVGNGWYRCSSNYTAAYTSATINLADDSNNISYTGNGTSGVYLWGAQLVEGTEPLEYLPTTTRLNIPRIDYSTGSAALLLEPQRTNLVSYSEDFGNAYWTKLGATISENTTTSPSGVMNADTLIESATTNVHEFYRTPFPATSGTYTLSVYVKNAVGSRFLNVSASNLSTDYASVRFSPSTATLSSVVVAGSFSNGSASFEALENGWYRVTLTYTCSTTSVPQIALSTDGSNSNVGSFGVQSYLGDGTSGIYIWGAQLEAGAYPTSYIPTTSATVTRNVDLCSKTGISSLIGQTEGTLYFQAKGLVDDSTYSLISLSDIGGANRISIGYANTATNLYFEYRVNSSYLINFNIGYIVKTDNNRIAVKYKLGEQAVFLNGVKIYSNTLSSAFTTALDRFSFDYNGGGFPYYGKVKALEIYTTSLTDAECIALTTP